MPMPVAMAMTMAVSGSAIQIAPCRNGDPTAEPDEGDAGGGVHKMSEARGDRDPGKPDHGGDDQGRDDVPDAGLQRRPGGLAFRPAALPGNERDWNPMVGDDGVQYADDADGD